MNRFHEIINSCLEKNLNFVVFSYPDQNNFQIIIEDPDSSKITNATFIFHPFRISNSTPTIEIPTHFHFLSDQLTEQNVKEVNDLNRVPLEQKEGPITEVSKSKYITDLSNGIQKMNSINLDKFIYSRISTNGKSTEFNLTNYLLKLRTKYKNTCTYLIHHIDSGMWMGATPETLVHWKEQLISTMSLAGTQQKTLDKSVDWSHKEIEEHQYVTNYIKQLFSSLHIPSVSSNMETMDAGPVVHLRTYISSQKKVSFNQALQFAKLLHPTPAVCGVPLKTALDFIDQIENHNRSYYTGYLGFVNPQKELRLFVNLRCMQIHSKKLALYVGGGITTKSDVEKEWEETKLKAQTLLHVLD
jgi:isochorismate synthase